MTEFGVPGKLIKLIRMRIEETQYQIMILGPPPKHLQQKQGENKRLRYPYYYLREF